jgi:hypothetical protein
MSSIKDKYYEACETTGSGIGWFGKTLKSESELALANSKRYEMETSEEICLVAGASYPDGSPLKGEDAIKISKIITDAICDSNFELLKNLQELGLLHK